MKFTVLVTGRDEDVIEYSHALTSAASQAVTDDSAERMSWPAALSEEACLAVNNRRFPDGRRRDNQDVVVEFACTLGHSCFYIEDSLMASAQLCVCPFSVRDRNSVSAARNAYRRFDRFKENCPSSPKMLMLVVFDNWCGEEDVTEEWRDLERTVALDEAVSVSYVGDVTDGCGRQTESKKLITFVCSLLDAYHQVDLSKSHPSSRRSSPHYHRRHRVPHRCWTALGKLCA